MAQQLCWLEESSSTSTLQQLYSSGTTILGSMTVLRLGFERFTMSCILGLNAIGIGIGIYLADLFTRDFSKE